MSTPIFTEREAISNRLNRVAYHLEDGLGPNGLLGLYTEEQADVVRGLLDDLHAVSDWLDAQPEAPEVMTIPEDVRNWIASAAQVASDSARYYDVDPSTSDAVLAWLDAQPAAPEPDWTTAPDWAQWWAVSARGVASWWAGDKPYIDGALWDNGGGKLITYVIDLPLGIDWRTTLRRRPEVTP